MAGPRPVPAPRTRFVGRRVELADLVALHHRDRLVTLVGPGGCGKTRLALELIRLIGAPTVWVELAATHHEDELGIALLGALGERDDPGREPLDQVVDAIELLGESPSPGDRRITRAGHTVLVIDNAEHLLEPIARLIDRVLARVSELRVVVTSREPLGITGEAVYRVPPMALADHDGPGPGGHESDAVDLFVDRASLVRPDLELDASAIDTVAEICRRLDGLPLAIELAAAQLHLLSPEHILVGLRDRLRLLVSGNRSALPRHRTLEASVEWSYSLLSSDERHLLDRLAVFRGSFDVVAAGATASGALHADRVDDVLGRLVMKSLVVAEPRPAGTRFRLLETIAAYAARQLGERGEVDAALDALAHHLAERTAPWDGPLQGDDEMRLLDALADDEDTVRVVLDHLAQGAKRGDADAADLLWRIVGRLTVFWRSAGRFGEASAWFSTAETVPASDPRLELPARWGASHLATYRGDFEAAIAGAVTTEYLADRLGDDRCAGRALATLASIECYLDPVAAIATLEQAIARSERASDLWGVTDARQVLAFTHLIRHDTPEALAELDLARPGAIALDHPFLLAWDDIGQATVAIARGQRAVARRAIESCRAQFARIDDPNLAALLVGLEATDALLGGTGAEWITALRDCWQRCERTEAGLTLPVVVADLLLVLVDQGDADAASAIVAGDLDDIATFAPTFAPRLHGIATSAALLAGDTDEALFRADLTRAAIDGSEHRIARAVAAPILALAHLERGDPGAAEAAVAAAAHVLSRLDLRPTLIDAVEVLALAVAARGDRSTAGWLATVGTDERARLGIVRTELQQLTAGRLAAACVDHDRRPRDATIEEAIAYVRRSRGMRRRPSIGWSSLTPTELQVVEAVAAGCTNAQVAERLFMAPSTVKTHLAHIYRKLDVHNRTALVAAAHSAASRDPEPRTPEPPEPPGFRPAP